VKTTIKSSNSYETSTKMSFTSIPLAGVFIIEHSRAFAVAFMGHSRRLRLSHHRIPSWDVVTKIALPSTRQACLCKNSMRDLTRSFCYQTLGMHCHFANNTT